jgi:hypothetical protein
MLLRELFLEGATMAWTRKGSNLSRKFRCTSGPRKGRVMASPASCNKPLDIHRSKQLKVTKSQKSSHIKTRGKITRRSGSSSVKLARLNKPRRRTPRRKVR